MSAAYPSRIINCLLYIFFILVFTSCNKQEAGGQKTKISSDTLDTPIAKSGFTGDDLAVIVNNADPLSVKIAEYYRQKRSIPEENIIHVSFNYDSVSLRREEFNRIKALVDSKTPKHVQAYALTWAKPYRVDCMSITTAFAMGFDEAHCAQGCQLTKINPYYETISKAPYKDFGIRPTMSIAATKFDQAKKLIDRGVESDHSKPTGTGYLLETSDKNRSIRAVLFKELARYMRDMVNLKYLKQDYISNKNDVLFYFTGLKEVPKLASNIFLAGAIADHLTSTGGRLTDSEQMSALKWLEAGATGSYGTVVEPCNIPGKFPKPGIVIANYTRGETLIESYWKSVAMPGQGIFIGEPLASPFVH